MLKLWSRTETVQRRTCSPKTRRRFCLAVESLEDRLALSWAGVPPATIVPPTNAAAVSLNALGDAQGNAAVTFNEEDFYTFVAPVSGSYRLEATTPSSNLDTVLGVFTATGSRIAFNDDIAITNRDSRLFVNLTAGARYYFGITNYTGTPGGSYTWVVDGPVSDDGFENNDSLAAPADLGTLTARRTINNLVMADAHDFFRFSTNAAGTAASGVTITFQHAQGDLDLALYNAGGQRIALSQGVSNSETISLNGLAAGTYLVEVYGYQGAFNPNYTLDIVPPTAPAPPPAGNFDIVLRVDGLTASQQAIFEQAAQRWEQVIIGDLPNATYLGVTVDDILIDARSRFIDGPGAVLGQAGPDAFRLGSQLPIHGLMEFDSADLAALEANGQLFDVILHEMGHVLGIGTIWSRLGLLTGAGTFNPRFLGQQATAAFNAIFGQNETSVPVEGLPSGPGSRDGHWRESVFGNELMSPYISGTPNPLSRVTVASLADLGYSVNLNAADAYTPPASGRAAVSAGSGGTAALVQGRNRNSCCCPTCQSMAAQAAQEARPAVELPALTGEALALENLSRLHNTVGGQRAVDAVYAEEREVGAAAAFVGTADEDDEEPSAALAARYAHAGQEADAAWEVDLVDAFAARTDARLI